jgi:hypothetical protein
VGWKDDEFGTESIVFKKTDLNINRPDAWFNLKGNTIDTVTFNVSDVVDQSDEDFLIDNFAAAAEAVRSVLGPGKRATGERPGIVWEASSFVGRLVQLERGVTIRLVRPEYQRISDFYEARGL